MNQRWLNSQYENYGEDFTRKRYQSSNLIRSKVHTLMIESAVNFHKFQDDVIDLGCGDGYASQLLALMGLEVTGIDISHKNIQAAKKRIQTKGGVNIAFKVGNACNTNFKNLQFTNSFSHHVLEHLADFEEGLAELKRITKRYIVIAVPSPWSPLAWTLLGGGTYWKFSIGGIPRLLLGLVRTVFSWSTNKIGIDENSYSNLASVPHIFYFPNRLRRLLVCSDWRIQKIQTQVKGFPWLYQSIRASSANNKLFGMGILVLLERVN